jgi:hypothetical protein
MNSWELQGIRDSAYFLFADYWTRVRCENGISTCYPNTQILTIKGKWDFPEYVAVVSWSLQQWVGLGMLRPKWMEATGGWRNGKYRKSCCSVCREGIRGSGGDSTCGQLYAPTFFSWGKSLLYPLNRRFRGPQSPPGRVGKDKTLLLPWMEPHLLGFVARCIVTTPTELSGVWKTGHNSYSSLCC